MFAKSSKPFGMNNLRPMRGRLEQNQQNQPEPSKPMKTILLLLVLLFLFIFKLPNERGGRPSRVRFGLNWPLIVLIATIPIVGLIAFSLFKRGKRGWGWVCVGLLIVLLLAILRVVMITGRHMASSSSGSWSAGGFGGGFGGGFSGGGGATGSW